MTGYKISLDIYNFGQKYFNRFDTNKCHLSVSNVKVQTF